MNTELINTMAQRSGLVRAWVAIWLQERRRRRLAALNGIQPPAPEIVAASWSWDTTEPGFVDVQITINFDVNSVPPAAFEVWEHDLNNGLRVVGTIPSGTGAVFDHTSIAEDSATFTYKVRYVNGETEGPFSAEYDVTPDPHP
jgi:hypothetical protein